MTEVEKSNYVFNNLLEIGFPTGVEIERRVIYNVIDSMLIKDVASEDNIKNHLAGKGYSPVQNTIEAMLDNVKMVKVDNGRKNTQYMLVEQEI